MKRIAIVVLLMTAPVWASTIFNDAFTTGVSSANWQSMTGNSYYQILVGDGAHSMGGAGDQSAKQVNADPWIYYMRTNPGAITAPVLTGANSEMLTVMVWDDVNNVAGQPTSGGVMLSNTSGGDFFQISVNSGAAGGYNYYNWRTQAQGTFSTGVARTQGWHKFQIEVLPYTGSGDVKFYIDDVQVATGNRNSAGNGSTFDQIRLGLSVKTYQPFWYDNVNLSVVPEPASVVLLVLGSCFLARRRA